MRSENFANIERLANCLEAESCGPGEEHVVILATNHFCGYRVLGGPVGSRDWGSHMQPRGCRWRPRPSPRACPAGPPAHTPAASVLGLISGEDIWAGSVMIGMDALNYTRLFTFETMEVLMIYQAIPSMVKVVIWESAMWDRCVQRNGTAVHPKDEDKAAWNKNQINACAQSATFPQGIPHWKSFAFHFWPGQATALGHYWTLQPEPYSKWRDVYGQFIGECVWVHVRAHGGPRCRPAPLTRRLLA